MLAAQRSWLPRYPGGTRYSLRHYLTGIQDVNCTRTSGKLYQDVWQAVPQIEAEIMSKKQAMQDIVANGYWRVMRATSTPSVIC